MVICAATSISWKSPTASFGQWDALRRQKLVVNVKLFGCHSCRAALRLWWPSFSPDWPSALNLFLFLFSLFFLFIFFIFRYFSFIFDCCSLGLLFVLYWSLSGPFVVSSLCLAASLSLSLIVVCSGLTATHLQALEIVLIIFPCPRLLFSVIF